MLKRAIHDRLSWNCIAAVPLSKPVISGSVTAKLRIAPISAIQRTTSFWSSRDSINNTVPMTIGNHMARLNNPMFSFFVGPQMPRRGSR